MVTYQGIPVIFHV